jgi:hypothetical protein
MILLCVITVKNVRKTLFFVDIRYLLRKKNLSKKRIFFFSKSFCLRADNFIGIFDEVYVKVVSGFVSVFFEQLAHSLLSGSVELIPNSKKNLDFDVVTGSSICFKHTEYRRFNVF